ncbi:hypothetical protein LUM37_02725 [Bacillus subtilis]|nr:hypothetical protein LUM37_02725 [Bacillus subtilis]
MAGTRIKLTDKHFAKLPDGKDSVWATDEFSFDEAEKALRKETVDTGGINVKVNVEVSEAITGLKALQREAKAATKALAELREEQRALNDSVLYLDGKEIHRASFRKELGAE